MRRQNCLLVRPVWRFPSWSTPLRQRMWARGTMTSHRIASGSIRRWRPCSVFPLPKGNMACGAHKSLPRSIRRTGRSCTTFAEGCSSKAAFSFWNIGRSRRRRRSAGSWPAADTHTDARGKVIGGQGIVVDVTESRRRGYAEGAAHFIDTGDTVDNETPLERAARFAIEASHAIDALGAGKAPRLRGAIDRLLMELGHQLSREG